MAASFLPQVDGLIFPWASLARAMFSPEMRSLVTKQTSMSTVHESTEQNAWYVC